MSDEANPSQLPHGGKDQGPSRSAPDSLINTRVGRAYWENAGADVNGMLGGIPSFQGFGSVSRVDLQGSRTFLARLDIGVKGGRKPITNALDGGAGVGRITEGLLLRVAEQVDLIEPIAKFTDPLKGKAGVGNIFNVGLEEWKPIKGVQYDLIWTQWCVGHLTDEELVQYLQVCKSVLTPESGVIVIKENLSTGDADIFDDTDSSVTRRDEKFRALFEEAGLRLIKTDIQRGLPEVPPKRLLPVRMYALKP